MANGIFFYDVYFFKDVEEFLRERTFTYKKKNNKFKKYNSGKRSFQGITILREEKVQIMSLRSLNYFDATSSPVSLVVLRIIDTKFYGFKGPRLYTARGGKIAKEDPRFEPSHDPSAISEDVFVEDVAILPRAWERFSPTVKFCRSGIRVSGFHRKKL